ncbi:phosphodiester glycosidase family protein [Anaerolineales bacterium HSG25]|nr:phosphodiester glycosidase family protein [Anaerolineales bacterium HSG25]
MRYIIIQLLGALFFCNVFVVTPLPQPTTSLLPEPPTLTASPPSAIVPTPSPTTVPDTGWVFIQSGLEQRHINLVDEAGRGLDDLYLIRLDPNLYRFDVAYHPTKPLTLEDWLEKTDALLAVNGGYFSVDAGEYYPTGLTVVDGQPMGVSYGDFAGMLAITVQGAELRWLAQHPYQADEPLLAGLQSFPLLVKPGGELGFPAEHEDNKRARRTVIGRDTQGRFILLVAARRYFTLHQLSRFLTESDLELDMAFNLDGGPSSGLLLANSADGISAQSKLPLVIVVYPK